MDMYNVCGGVARHSRFINAFVISIKYPIIQTYIVSYLIERSNIILPQLSEMEMQIQL